MSFVAVDLGASNTRHISNEGKVGVIPNNMVILPMETKVDLEEYNSGKITDSLEVIIEKDGDSEFFPAHALIGNMATRYTTTNVRPSVLVNKHEQQINYISGVVACALNIYAYNLGDSIDMYLDLPPVEVKTAKEKVKKEFIGRYTVKFPKLNGGVEVSFNISNVHCYEESFMAILSYFFDAKGAVKESSKKYMTGKVLSLDIGASTTDLAIVDNGRYLEKSGRTYKIGGNFARDIIAEAISSEYGFDLPDEDSERALAEGRLQLGNSYKDITEIIERAKSDFADRVVSQMDGYFKAVNIPIHTIRAIVVSGGGSMKSQYSSDEGNVHMTSEPMSYYLTEKLKNVCNTIEVESYEGSPRFANIVGLYIRAKLDEAKKEKERDLARSRQMEKVEEL